jgi:1-acyl-sn-glycerol-3-phosphate acyltransferase
MVTANEMRGCQGWLIRRLGGFAIDPRRPGIASLRHGLQLLQAEQMLTIFPEGDIFRDGAIHPLKPGLARLALQAERDRPGLNPQIVPIHIHYDRPVPTWGSTVAIQIGEPIAIAAYQALPPKAATRAILTDLHLAIETLATSPAPRPRPKEYPQGS